MFNPWQHDRMIPHGKIAIYTWWCQHVTNSNFNFNFNFNMSMHGWEAPGLFFGSLMTLGWNIWCQGRMNMLLSWTCQAVNAFEESEHHGHEWTCQTMKDKPWISNHESRMMNNEWSWAERLVLWTCQTMSDKRIMNMPWIWTSNILATTVQANPSSQTLALKGASQPVGAKFQPPRKIMCQPACHVMPCNIMLCHAMSCYVMWCHVMSCHVM